MLDSTIGSPRRRGVLWVAVGRQRVGKTALLSAAAQFFRARGAPLQVWNADQQNRSHTLSSFFDDAIEMPAGGGIADGRAWIEERLVTLARDGGSAVLDTGGGWTAFSSLVDDLPLADVLGQAGIQVVALFVVGPEQADLDYLEHFAVEGRFMPPASLVVMNSALVLSDRSVSTAFGKVREHRVVRGAMARGASMVTMPMLGCMSAFADRGLSFEDVLAERYPDGGEPLSIFDVARVNKWWNRDLPTFFGAIPAAWLPLSIPEAAKETV